MDNRAWASGASASPPTAPASPSVGYPTAGDPGNGIPATKGGAFWFHQLGEEMRAVLTAAGITPSTANNAQLLEAIQRLIDAQSGNYALDTGAANAYVVALSPAITAYSDGMTVRVKAVNANNGASTLNAGAGAVSLVNDVGGALAGGDVPAGSVFAATYIASAGNFYITSLVPSQTMTQAAADARYAALAGLSTQLFSSADGATGKQVVNISQFSNSFATNGYQKLPGGLIIQWGQVFNSASADTAVTFPIAFPTLAYAISNTSMQGGAAYMANVHTLSTAGFNSAGWINGARSAIGSYWIAVGS